MMSPPVRGMFSRPRQSRFVNRYSRGWIRRIASRYQKPNLPRRTLPSLPCRSGHCRGDPLVAGARTVRIGRVQQRGSEEAGGGASAYWSAVIPVKLLQAAKTRIEVAAPQHRAALARAMALDTIEAVSRCAEVAEVIVVTDEDEIATTAGELSVFVVNDAPAAGLNAALEHGAAVARRRRPDCGVVAVAADLPAMRPEELGLVLRTAAAVTRAAVPDAAGAGTVVLTAAAATELTPAYGEESLARHQRGGAVVLGADVLGVDVPGIRRDVDTIADLRVALRLGCGPRTTGVA